MLLCRRAVQGTFLFEIKEFVLVALLLGIETRVQPTRGASSASLTRSRMRLCLWLLGVGLHIKFYTTRGSLHSVTNSSVSATQHRPCILQCCGGSGPCG